jgi:hypothetical protein
MKTNTSIIRILTIIFISYILFSCDSGPYRLDAYLIKVDSIHLPASINSNTPFDIEFFGTIAGDGCHCFGEFTQSMTNNDIIVEAWGNYIDYSGKCPTVMVYLTGHKLTMTIPSPGVYNIKIKQPDKTYLTRQITVN